MFTNFFRQILSLFARPPKTLAITGKIKVNNARVGDPDFNFDFETEREGDTFPNYVFVLGYLTWTDPNPNQVFPFTGIGQATGTSATSVSLDCSFTDNSFLSGQHFTYNVSSVSFSTDGINWTTFSVNNVDNATNSVTSTT